MKLDVPYYSQFLDIADPFWKDRACGITSLKMVLDFYDFDTPSLDELIQEGVFMNGYTKNGWMHDVLVKIARNHGANAYGQEFKSHKIDLKKKTAEVSKYEEKLLLSGIEKIIDTIESGAPVIVSVPRQFEDGGEFHVVVLTGIVDKQGETTGFYYNESDSKSREDGFAKFVDIKTFKKTWRKFAIFVYSPKCLT